MRFEQSWQGQNLTRQDGVFPASVPGCIQQDYAAAKGWGDVQYADNCRAYEALEDDTWEYSAVLRYERAPGERVVFVSRGIDYRYEIRLNGASVLFYTDCLKRFASDIGRAFFVLPSSIHEVLLLPVMDEMSAWDERPIVGTMNHQVVSDEEVLSDHVYRYLHKCNKLIIAA